MNGLLQNAGSGSEAMTPRRDGAGIKEPTPSFTADGLPSGTAERKSAKGPPPRDPKETGLNALLFA